MELFDLERSDLLLGRALHPFHEALRLGDSEAVRAALGPAVKRAVVRALVMLVVVGTHFLWRHATYGEWFPNTFYAKVPGAYFE